MFSLANTYAKLKKTTIIAYDLKEDGTIVFVVEAGGKYKMTKEELEKAIRDLTPHEEHVSEPFQYIEKAVDLQKREGSKSTSPVFVEITPQPKRRKARS